MDMEWPWKKGEWHMLPSRWGRSRESRQIFAGGFCHPTFRPPPHQTYQISASTPRSEKQETIGLTRLNWVPKYSQEIARL